MWRALGPKKVGSHIEYIISKKYIYISTMYNKVDLHFSTTKDQNTIKHIPSTYLHFNPASFFTWDGDFEENFSCHFEDWVWGLQGGMRMKGLLWNLYWRSRLITRYTWRGCAHARGVLKPRNGVVPEVRILFIVFLEVLILSIIPSVTIQCILNTNHTIVKRCYMLMGQS